MIVINNNFSSQVKMPNCQSCITEKATHGYKGGSKLYCKKCAKNIDNVGNLTRRSCKEETCWTEPYWNYSDDKKGLYCAKHALDGMIDHKHPKCIYIDEDGVKCTKYSSYGPEGDKPLFCQPHSLLFDDMVCLSTHKKCAYKDDEGNKCSAPANYNLPGSETGMFCGKHRRAEDEYIRKCYRCVCGKRASYNYLTEKIPLFCELHKKEFMWNIADPRCDICADIFLKAESDEEKRQLQVKMATHAGPDGKRKLCGEHSEAGMENTRAKKCEFPGCTTQASWNTKNSKARKLCSLHADKNVMDNVKNAKCVKCGEREALCNKKGETKRLYCSRCKDDDMVILSSKICKNDYVIDGELYQCLTTASSKYDGYCARCYVGLFPYAPKSQNYKTKEFKVYESINENFPEIKIVCDKIISSGYSRRRPDMCIYMKDYNIIIEVDEHQHNGYAEICENMRMMQLFTDLKNKPLVMIRFNPDAYIKSNNVRVKSCWTHNKEGMVIIHKNKRDDWNNRLLKLRKTIDYYLNNPPTKDLEVCYLYYDEIERPKVEYHTYDESDDDYDEHYTPAAGS